MVCVHVPEGETSPHPAGRPPPRLRRQLPQRNADDPQPRHPRLGAPKPPASDDHHLAAAVRLGYKVSPRGTIYALAGYSNARFRFDYTTPAGALTRDHANLDGFRFGAGYQHGFGEKAYGKVEYRNSNYENDVTRHQVLLGVGMIL